MAVSSVSPDREIVMTRVFDAPRELVFDAWTDPKHVAQWWGPHGFSNTISEMDVRPGGHWRMVMHGPDGADYPNHIVFIEVVKPERLVYRHEPEHGAEPVSFEVTLTFAARGGKTELTMRMLFASAAEREYVIEKHGAMEGIKQTLGRLAEHLPQMADLVMTRIFEAPRDLVFTAWTDPEHLRQWWGPTGFTNPVCELDLRPGGAIRIDMRAPDGVVYPMSGVFREISEPERLVFTSAALDVHGKPMFENLNIVVFEEYEGKTKLTLHVRVLSKTAEAAPHLAGMEMGWKLTLDRLADSLRRPR